MDQESFEKAMDTIRESVDKVYLFEGDRKPILFVHAKKENQNLNDLLTEIEEFFSDRLDVLVMNEYDLVQVGEKAPETDDDEISLDLG